MLDHPATVHHKQRVRNVNVCGFKAEYKQNQKKMTLLSYDKHSVFFFGTEQMVLYQMYRATTSIVFQSIISFIKNNLVIT